MPLPVTSAKATSVALDELVELLEAEADAAAEALEADELCASAPAARPRSIMREAMARERISGARQWWTEGRAGRGDANELTKAKGAATRVACHEGGELARDTGRPRPNLLANGSPLPRDRRRICGISSA